MRQSKGAALGVITIGDLPWLAMPGVFDPHGHPIGVGRDRFRGEDQFAGEFAGGAQLHRGDHAVGPPDRRHLAQARERKGNMGGTVQPFVGGEAGNRDFALGRLLPGDEMPVIELE